MQKQLDSAQPTLDDLLPTPELKASYEHQKEKAWEVMRQYRKALRELAKL